MTPIFKMPIRINAKLLLSILCLTLIFQSSRAQTYPPNPWGGKWEHIYDGRNQTTPLLIKDKNNVLIINNTIHDVRNAKAALDISNCKRVLIINNTVTRHIYKGHGSGIRVAEKCQDVIIDNNHLFELDGNGISTSGSSTYCLLASEGSRPKQPAYYRKQCCLPGW